jgi:hypothetical protein
MSLRRERRLESDRWTPYLAGTRVAVIVASSSRRAAVEALHSMGGPLAESSAPMAEAARAGIP